jgi:hypothetical protein
MLPALRIPMDEWKLYRCITLNGNSIGSTLRIDLPRQPGKELPYALTVPHYLTSDTKATSIMGPVSWWCECRGPCYLAGYAEIQNVMRRAPGHGRAGRQRP